MSGKFSTENAPSNPEHVYAGIDVGGSRKGFHLAVVNSSGTVTDLAHLKSAEAVLRYLIEIQPVCIAIDGPARSSRRGPTTREAEREIRSLDYRIQWTPQASRQSPDWMKNSERLWRELRDNLRGTLICETFPTAIQDRLLTEDIQLPVSLLQSRFLRPHIEDLFDAVLAAVAARRIHRRELAVFGQGDEIGGIYLPRDPFRDYTLTLLLTAEKILLGKKKRGLGEGYWNGFGGKVEDGETLANAAIREIHEEVGLSVHMRDLLPAGLLYFTFEDASIHPIRGTVFRAESFSGNPVESDEMLPEWFAINDIPFSEMWADDIFWFPLMLEKRPFVASFHVNMNHQIERRTLVESEEVANAIQRGKRRRPSTSI